MRRAALLLVCCCCLGTSAVPAAALDPPQGHRTPAVTAIAPVAQSPMFPEWIEWLLKRLNAWFDGGADGDGSDLAPRHRFPCPDPLESAEPADGGGAWWASPGDWSREPDPTEPEPTPTIVGAEVDLDQMVLPTSSHFGAAYPAGHSDLIRQAGGGLVRVSVAPYANPASTIRSARAEGLQVLVTFEDVLERGASEPVIQWVQDTVRVNGPDVAYWQLDNEWTGQAVEDSEGTLATFRTLAAAIREVDPDAQVGPGGLASQPLVGAVISFGWDGGTIPETRWRDEDGTLYVVSREHYESAEGVQRATAQRDVIVDGFGEGIFDFGAVHRFDEVNEDPWVFAMYRSWMGSDAPLLVTEWGAGGVNYDVTTETWTHALQFREAMQRILNMAADGVTASYHYRVRGGSASTTFGNQFVPWWATGGTNGTTILFSPGDSGPRGGLRAHQLAMLLLQDAAAVSTDSGGMYTIERPDDRRIRVFTTPGTSATGSDGDWIVEVESARAGRLRLRPYTDPVTVNETPVVVGALEDVVTPTTGDPGVPGTPSPGTPVDLPPGAVFASSFEWAFDSVRDAQTHGWNYEQVKPNGGQPGGAHIETAVGLATDGTRALHCYVPNADPASSAREGATSKSSLGYTKSRYTKGDIVTIAADFYIPSSSRGRVTIFDLEDNTTAGNAGLRFQLEDGRVTYNPDKIGYSVIKRPATIPKDRWFPVTVEVTPGDRSSGHVRMWVDDSLVLDEQTPTVRSDFSAYTSVQAGITARLDTTFELYMDNFGIYVTDTPAGS